MLIVGEYVTNRCHDKEELAEIVKSIGGEIYGAETIAADSGYYREEGVKEVEGRDEEGTVPGKTILPVIYAENGLEIGQRDKRM
jgi:hypothetical protein